MFYLIFIPTPTTADDGIKAVYSEWANEWDMMINSIDDQCDTILFSLRNLEGIKSITTSIFIQVINITVF